MKNENYYAKFDKTPYKLARFTINTYRNSGRQKRPETEQYNKSQNEPKPAPLHLFLKTIKIPSGSFFI